MRTPKVSNSLWLKEWGDLSLELPATGSADEITVDGFCSISTEIEVVTPCLAGRTYKSHISKIIFICKLWFSILRSFSTHRSHYCMIVQSYLTTDRAASMGLSIWRRRDVLHIELGFQLHFDRFFFGGLATKSPYRYRFAAFLWLSGATSDTKQIRYPI